MSRHGLNFAMTVIPLYECALTVEAVSFQGLLRHIGQPPQHSINTCCNASASVEVQRTASPQHSGRESGSSDISSSVQGLVKAVGVSNYGPRQLERIHQYLTERGVPLASAQVAPVSAIC